MDSKIINLPIFCATLLLFLSCQSTQAFNRLDPETSCMSIEEEPLFDDSFGGSMAESGDVNQIVSYVFVNSCKQRLRVVWCIDESLQDSSSEPTASLYGNERMKCGYTPGDSDSEDYYPNRPISVPAEGRARINGLATANLEIRYAACPARARGRDVEIRQLAEGDIACLIKLENQW